MEANIVFNYSSSFVSNVILCSSVFISLCVFFYFCLSSNFGVYNFLFSSFFIFTFAVVFGSVFYYILYYNDIEFLEPLKPYIFKFYNLALYKDNTIGIDSNPWINDFGVIFGIVFGVLISSFVFNFNVYKLLDCCISPIFILLSGFRLSDLFICKNCGLPTDSSFGVIFPTIDYLPRHASMMYEFVLLFILAAVLVYVVKKIYNSYDEDYNKDGYMFFFGIFLISLIKLLFSVIQIQDNIMSNALYDILKLGASQFIALVFLVISLIFSIYCFPRKK